eukprot:TRINITY_DN15662_c0_g1_i1.p1 TRINITY_DN15662_c0_g1~~TRINITY_DN15662_c0_g1_i1.p1  ORF type:complete len:174 (+),score=42.92 TRINITY_DN15662_c0_g1_i1:51-572(+)
MARIVLALFALFVTLASCHDCLIDPVKGRAGTETTKNAANGCDGADSNSLTRSFYSAQSTLGLKWKGSHKNDANVDTVVNVGISTYPSKDTTFTTASVVGDYRNSALNYTLPAELTENTKYVLRWQWGSYVSCKDFQIGVAPVYATLPPPKPSSATSFSLFSSALVFLFSLFF